MMNYKRLTQIAMLFIVLCGSVFGEHTRADALGAPSESKEVKPHFHHRIQHHSAHAAKRHSQHQVHRP
jgi:hypothetical protein